MTDYQKRTIPKYSKNVLWEFCAISKVQKSKLCMFLHNKILKI